jgi:hypothetical protein
LHRKLKSLGVVSTAKGGRMVRLDEDEEEEV